MRIHRSRNDKLQEQGSQTRETVHDQNTHMLLENIGYELKAIRFILSYMADLDLDSKNIGGEYDN